MYQEKRAWRKDRAEFREEIAAERRASRAELEAFGSQIGGALRENTMVMRALLQRLGARPGDVTGQHQRVAQERVRKQTGSQPIAEEAAGE
jgi:hypothetical protein